MSFKCGLLSSYLKGCRKGELMGRGLMIHISNVFYANQDGLFHTKA